MADLVRISDMTQAVAPYSGLALFEVSIPADAGGYGSFKTSLDDIAASLGSASLDSYVILTPLSGDTLDVPAARKVIYRSLARDSAP
jgi:hypothetical protein